LHHTNKHQVCGFEKINIAVTKPDKISTEKIKPCFFVSLLFVILREIVEMSDKRNRQAAKTRYCSMPKYSCGVREKIGFS